MADKKPKKTIGMAIDELIKALEGLDESAMQIAIKATCEHLNIAIGQIYGQKPSEFTTQQISGEAAQSTFNQMIDIRSLKKEKSPSSAVEMACIVAFYLEHHVQFEERKEAITTEDIDKYFKQAGYPVPKAQSQVLVDAKAAGYFDRIDSGTYKLNPVGYNLVVHSMPSTNIPSKKTGKKKKVRKPLKKKK